MSADYYNLVENSLRLQGRVHVEEEEEIVRQFEKINV